mmetsp:Transcript_38093/g.112805  ORF Transcript_38093/g.112805 Transcript_38093/m.112805 type:complete len:268 (-) Transcript_38093:585-1388(-)
MLINLKISSRELGKNGKECTRARAVCSGVKIFPNKMKLIARHAMPWLRSAVASRRCSAPTSCHLFTSSMSIARDNCARAATASSSVFIMMAPFRSQHARISSTWSCVGSSSATTLSQWSGGGGCAGSSGRVALSDIIWNCLCGLSTNAVPISEQKSLTFAASSSRAPLSIVCRVCASETRSSSMVACSTNPRSFSACVIRWLGQWARERGCGSMTGTHATDGGVEQRHAIKNRVDKAVLHFSPLARLPSAATNLTISGLGHGHARTS